MISRPAAPDSPEDRDTMRRDFERGVYEREKVESETPETDALIESYMSLSKLTMEFAEHARSLERRLSLAQTEIKGHMRVIHELGEAVRRAQADERHATYQYSEAQARIAILEEELRRSKNAPA